MFATMQETQPARPLRRTHRTIAVTVTVAVTCTVATISANVTPAHANSSDADDIYGLVDARDATVAIATGTDHVAVWVCRVPTDTTDPTWTGNRRRVNHTPEQLATWANTRVAPHWTTTSGGRYRSIFHPAGTITLTAHEGPTQCRDRAIDASGNATSVLAVDNTTATGGYASGGVLGRNLTDPAAYTGRGAYVGGGTITEGPRLVLHELGHTLHWPHSSANGDEYGNEHDLMSAARVDDTLALNLYASGWLDTKDITVLHSGKTAHLGAGHHTLAALWGPDGRWLSIEQRHGHALAHIVTVHRRNVATAELLPGPAGGLWPPGSHLDALTWTVTIAEGLDGTITATAGASTDGRLHAAVTWAKAVWRDLTGTAISDHDAIVWLTGPVQTQGARRAVESLARDETWIGHLVDGWYRDTLGRPGDDNGRRWWIDTVAQGNIDVERAGAYFYASSEWRSRFADTGTWIDGLYQAVLQRTADTEGRAWWTTYTGDHGEWATAWRIYQSVESRQRRVDQLYRKLLGRGSDAEGVTYWAERITGEGDIALAGELTMTGEYLQRALNGA